MAARIPNQITPPAYTRETLPNGMVVYLIPEPESGSVVIRAVFRGGSESDPAGLAGLSALTAELLRNEAANRAAKLDASFDVASDEQSSSVTMRTKPVWQDRALAAFGEVLIRPVFSDAQFMQARAKAMARAKSVKGTAAVAADLYFRSLLFGPEHPYASPAAGEELSLKLIDLKAVAEYYKRIYAGRNLIVLAAGDFQPSRILASIANTFGAMPAGEQYKWVEDTPPEWPATPRMLVVNDPHAARMNLVVGQPGVTRNNPQRAALLLMNVWLNSILSGGASSVLDQRRLTGSFSIHGSTQPENAGKAVNLALAIFNQIRQKGISEGELAASKALLRESAEAAAAEQPIEQLAQAELSGEGMQPDAFLNQVDGLTRGQVHAAIGKYIGAGNLSFVLMGNAANTPRTLLKWQPSRRAIKCFLRGKRRIP